MDLEQRASRMLEDLPMAQLAEKLNQIGGEGKLAEKEWRIRNRLKWHDKAKSAIRHLLHRERNPSLEEARQIEAAHLKWCAEQVELNRRNNEQLFLSMRAALEAMERTDPEFYGPTVEEVRQLLFQNRPALRLVGGEN